VHQELSLLISTGSSGGHLLLPAELCHCFRLQTAAPVMEVFQMQSHHSPR
jgi:hypothetical protein